MYPDNDFLLVMIKVEFGMTLVDQRDMPKITLVMPWSSLQNHGIVRHLFPLRKITRIMI